MHITKQLILAAITVIITITTTSCNNNTEKEKSITVENEFTTLFSNLNLPLTIADTSLEVNTTKAAQIKIATKAYIPNKVVTTFFEPDEKITYYPVGKAQNADQEIYLVIKAKSENKKAAFLLVYDNLLNYKDGLLLCKTDENSKTTYTATLKKDFNIIIRKSESVANDEPIITESSLAYNNAGYLQEVVTNFSDEQADLTNPIDTMPQNHPFTGDYYYDAKNFISIRNNRDSSKLMFFYHYENNKADCSGEIKDNILITGTNTAVYLNDGDPCVINLLINNGKLTLTEDHGCGNKRALNCTLNGVFTKRAKKNAPKLPTKNTNEQTITPEKKIIKPATPITNTLKPKPKKIVPASPPKPKPTVAPVVKPELKQPDL